MVKKIQLRAWLTRSRKFSFRRWFSFRLRRPRITAIDVDGQMLRVVQTIHRYGRTRVTKFAAEELDLSPEGEAAGPQRLGTAIAAGLERLKWKPNQVVMGVARAQVVLRTLALPEIDHAGELASMVHFQLAKDLPFPIDEAIIDFKVQSRRESSLADTAMRRAGSAKESSPDSPDATPKVQVLVAAIKREVVQFFQDTAAAAGFTLAALGLRSYANARCVEACNLTTSGETVALVSLRPDEVIIDVLEGRFLVFSRVAPVKQPTQAGGAEESSLVVEVASDEPDLASQLDIAKPVEEVRFAQAVTIEVVRSLHSYQGTVLRRPVVRVVVSGGTGHERDVVEALQNRLSIPARLLDPASALGLPKSAHQHAPGAMVAFGLGIGVNDPEGLPFDFLNPKRPTAPPSPRRVKILTAATAGAALLVMLLALRAYLIGQRYKEQRKAAIQLEQERKNRPIYQKMQLQTQTVLDWKREARNWLDYYTSLSTNMPTKEEIYLSSISMSGPGVIRMGVLAKSGEILAKMAEQLRAAGYKVDPLAITPVPEKGGYSFKSSVELSLPERKNTASPAPKTSGASTKTGVTTPKTTAQKPAGKGGRP
jgi:type IV pilus assembly protein PilM